jgi:hypothetical protein
MLARKELIGALADLAAPLTPFTLEGAPKDDALFIDWLERRSRERFERILDDALDAFIDVVTHPPAPHEYIPPARDEGSFKAELLGLAELYGRSPHALRIIQGLEPVLGRPSQRLWAIEVLGCLKQSAALLQLRALVASSLTKEEALGLVDALDEVGGAEARAILTELRERRTEAEVRSRIDALLAPADGR